MAYFRRDHSNDLAGRVSNCCGKDGWASSNLHGFITAKSQLPPESPINVQVLCAIARNTAFFPD
jgi:hypothetical protein